MRIRRLLLQAAIPMALSALHPSVAEAESPLDVTVRVESRYIETQVFNGVFSNSPSVQVEATYSLTPDVYVSAYGYTGLHQPFSDESSEYGLEAGYEHDIGTGTTLNLAVGRYADYAGEGFRAGDWYGKVGIEHGRVSASVSRLIGDTDSTLLYAAYTLPVGERLTLRPSAAYFVDTDDLNPGLDVNYQLFKHVFVGGRFVLPKNDSGHRRAYGAGMLSYHF